MSDGKMSIDEITEFIDAILKACIIIRSQLGHDFGSIVTTEGDKKFKLSFERIDD